MAEDFKHVGPCTKFKVGEEFIACCNDGTRPVIFRIERTE